MSRPFARRASPRRARLRSGLRHRAAGLQQRTLALGLALAAVGVAIVVVAWQSTSGLPFESRYPFTVILPASTPPIDTNDQVRIAGKVAGGVSSVEPQDGRLRVNAYLRGSYAPLGRGASVHVGVLLGTTLVYLIVEPGDYHHPLPAGTVIPNSRVTVSSTLPQALEAFDAATRRALARDITVTGEGWLGRGQETNGALADLRADLRDGIPLLRAVDPAPGMLGRLIAGAAATAQGLEGLRPGDLGQATSGSADFFQTLATGNRAGELTARFAAVERQLLATLPQTDPALAQAADSARAFDALTRQVAGQLPAFETLFGSGGPLVQGSARLAAASPPVLRSLPPLLQQLRRPALTIPLIAGYGRRFARAVNAYAAEINSFGQRLAEATSFTLGGVPVLRTTSTIVCSSGRDPYPAPGQAARDRKPC